MEFNYIARVHPEPVRAKLRKKLPMRNLVYDQNWRLWEYRFENGRVVYTYMQISYLMSNPYL